MAASRQSEYEASSLAHRIAESQRPGVKTRLFELEAYPADFLRFDGVAEITPIEAGDAVGKVWDREKVEELLGETAGLKLERTPEREPQFESMPGSQPFCDEQSLPVT